MLAAVFGTTAKTVGGGGVMVTFVADTVIAVDWFATNRLYMPDLALAAMVTFANVPVAVAVKPVAEVGVGEVLRNTAVT